MTKLGEQEMSTKFEQKKIKQFRFWMPLHIKRSLCFSRNRFEKKTFLLEQSKPVLEVLCNIWILPEAFFLEKKAFKATKPKHYIIHYNCSFLENLHI